jgi:CRP-like cAMP-binding protein
MTVHERVMATVVYLAVLVINGSVQGLITTLLIGTSMREREIAGKLRAVKTWMASERVPATKQRMAMRYFSQLYKSRISYNPEEIMTAMPPGMRNEFAHLLYEGFLEDVPMFRGLSTEIVTALCNIIVPMVVVKGQIIIAEGSTGSELYLLMIGELEISKSGERLGFLSDGAFFGEVALLSSETGSEIRSRTVVAVTDSKICFLPLPDLTQIMRRYPEFEMRIRKISRFGRPKVNRKGNKYKEVRKLAAVERVTRGATLDRRSSFAHREFAPRIRPPLTFINDENGSKSARAKDVPTTQHNVGSNRFDQLEQNMHRMDTKIEGVEAKLDRVADSLDTLVDLVGGGREGI